MRTIGRSCFIPWPNNRQHRVIADPFFKGAFISFSILIGDNQTLALSEHDGYWSSSLTSVKGVPTCQFCLNMALSSETLVQHQKLRMLGARAPQVPDCRAL
ncbi:hypothetical protein VNO80_10283 [Phaseolus coccineus]|uniref:Uncharacterized protein n=1 Tax=Phaseolus coccineus TaxID=3886 RepID=A0AAN9ND56_PHACN